MKMLSNETVIGWNCFMADAERKRNKKPASGASNKNNASNVKSPMLIYRRMIGLALLIAVLVFPFVSEGAEGLNFLIAMFVLFPLPLMFLPYLASTLYLMSRRETRRLDMVIIATCALFLLTAVIAPPLVGMPVPILVIALLVALFKRGGK